MSVVVVVDTVVVVKPPLTAVDIKFVEIIINTDNFPNLNQNASDMLTSISLGVIDQSTVELLACKP